MLGYPRDLNDFVQRHGGADDQLYRGSTVTSRMAVELAVRTDTGLYEYRFVLSNAHPDRLVFTEEAVRDRAGSAAGEEGWYSFADRHPEATVVYAPQINAIPPTERNAARAIVSMLRSCAAYQFHDTSDNSNFMKRWDAEDNDYLLPHGGNLAAVLHRIEREDPRRFQLISRHIQRVLPVFDRFQIEERYGKVLLRWKAVGSDKTFGAHLTSDGSLRFFALVTLLSLPREMLPAVLLLDEPELGLHPVGRVADWRHDQGACSRPSDHRGDAVSAIGRCVRFGRDCRCRSRRRADETPETRLEGNTNDGSTIISRRASCGRRICSEGVHDALGRLRGRRDGGRVHQGRSGSAPETDEC